MSFTETLKLDGVRLVQTVTGYSKQCYSSRNVTRKRAQIPLSKHLSERGNAKDAH